MKNKRKNGFTLIELLAVIVILAVLALLAITAVLPLIRKSQFNAFKQDADQIIKAAEAAYGAMLVDGTACEDTVADGFGENGTLSDGNPACTFDLRALVDHGYLKKDDAKKFNSTDTGTKAIVYIPKSGDSAKESEIKIKNTKYATYKGTSLSSLTSSEINGLKIEDLGKCGDGSNPKQCIKAV